MRTGFVVAALAALATMSSCGRGDGAIDLRSGAFADGEIIPERFSCEGDNISPPLSWSDVPDDAVELALVMADFETSTGIFHHWVVLGIDADDRSLETGELPDGAVLAQASSQNPVYIGPCPPRGERHEYLLTLFPLRERIRLPSGTPTKDALDAIDAARLPGEGELRGIYVG